MCIKGVETDPSSLRYVADRFKTQEMCDKAFEEDSSSLQYAPNWFVVKSQANMWYDDYYNDDNYNEIIEWHNGYQKRKAQKAKIKKS